MASCKPHFQYIRLLRLVGILLLKFATFVVLIFLHCFSKFFLEDGVLLKLFFNFMQNFSIVLLARESFSPIRATLGERNVREVSILRFRGDSLIKKIRLEFDTMFVERDGMSKRLYAGILLCKWNMTREYPYRVHRIPVFTCKDSIVI